MNRIKSLFAAQKYLECVDLLADVMKKPARMNARDRFESTMMYGVSLLEYGILYEQQYKAYQQQKHDYDVMVQQGYADYAKIEEIRAPEEYFEEALQALYAAQQLLHRHFPEETMHNFGLSVHIIRCQFLLKSNNISAEIDRFIQFLDSCGESRWAFEKYPECLAEIATFCQNAEQAQLIRQELAWYWREQYCMEQGKKSWRLVYVKYGTPKAQALEKEYQKYV